MGCLCKGRRSDTAGYEKNRSCTDILMLVLFILFWVAFAVVAGIAFKNGDVRRLLRGTDFAGNLCGVEGQENQPTEAELAAIGGGPWKDRDKIWYPIVPDISSFQLKHLGFCVSECPQGPNITIDFSNPPSNLSDLVPLIKSYAVNGSAGRIDWLVLYNSTDFLHRCLPLDDLDHLSSSFAKEVSDVVPVIDATEWLFSQMAQVASAWKVILICVGAAFVVSFIWIFLLRWLVRPVVYIMLLLVLLFLVGLGVFLWIHSNNVKDEQPIGSPDWHIALKVGAVVSWVLAVIYLLILIFMWKNIRIAISLIKCSARVMTQVFSLITVPFLFFFLVVGLAAFCGLVAAYLQSSGDLETDEIVLPSFIVNTTGVNNQINSIQTQIVTDPKGKDYLTLYTVFAFLWGLAFLESMSYMMIAFVAVFWYFSQPGDDKKAPKGSVLRAMWWTLRYHIGTVAFGSLIIAIIQFIKFLLSRLEKYLDKVTNNPAKCAAKCCIKCAQCCLSYFERVLNVINHTAYVITCIECSGFCVSAVRGIRLLIDNLGKVATVGVMGDWVIWFSKVLITAGNVCLGWVLITETDLTDEEDAVFPLIVIGILTYVIASIILHVFGTIIDTLIISFCRDVEKNNGHDKPYYMTSDLKKIMNLTNDDLNNDRDIGGGDDFKVENEPPTVQSNDYPFKTHEYSSPGAAHPQTPTNSCGNAADANEGGGLYPSLHGLA